MDASERPTDRPEVTVVIPTRNRLRLLKLALASVLDQRGVRLEVLVIDEGSTDDVGAAIAAIGDARIRVVRHATALGKSAARNRGIAESTGDWIAFLDDDDVWAPDKLASQLEALRSTGREWAYTGAVNITDDHRILGGAPPAHSAEHIVESLHRVNSIPGGCSGVVVSKKSLPPDGFDPQYRLCEDWDLWIRLARRGPPACVTRPLVGYRIHAGNSSADTATYLAELDMIESRYGGRVDRVVFFRYLARVCLRMNRQREAFSYYLRAVAAGPSYTVRGFVPDIVGLIRSLADRIRGRLGWPVSRAVDRRADADGEWKEEARVWLDQFVLRHNL